MVGRSRSRERGIALSVTWIPALWLTLIAAGENVLTGDVRVARRIQTLDGGLADPVASFGNWIGTYAVGAAISLPLIVLLVLRHRRREAVLLILILIVRALNNTIKGLIDSPRPTPDLIRVTEEAHGLGFPSGHAMGATLLFGALGLLAWRLLPARPLRLAALAACALVVVATGFGRIHTGAHWPSDVLGGFLLGLAVLFLLADLLGLVRLGRTGEAPRSRGVAAVR